MWVVHCIEDPAAYLGPDRIRAQEVGGTLIGEDGLVRMAGVESVEWYQIH
jgi:hypothetical protein